MKHFLLLLAASLSFSSYAQKFTPFDPNIKKADLKDYYGTKQQQHYERFTNAVYNGCTQNREQEVPLADLGGFLDYAKDYTLKSHQHAFDADPDLKAKFEKEMNALKSCQDNCRVKSVGLILYYTNFLRPELPACSGKKIKSADKALCGAVSEYQDKDIPLTLNSGLEKPALLRDAYVNQKNFFIRDMMDNVFGKFSENICEQVSGVVYNYDLFDKERGSTYSLYAPKPVVVKTPTPTPTPTPTATPKPCVEKVSTIDSRFVPANFEEGSSEIDESKLPDLQGEVNDMLAKNKGLILTDIIVTSSSSRTPYKINGKIPADDDVVGRGKSDQKNLDLAKQRADLAVKIINELRANKSESLKNINVSPQSEITGPDFKMADFKLREVSSSSPNFKAEMEKLYDSKVFVQGKEVAFKDILLEKALIKSKDEFLAKGYKSLYQARFKPFQGFRIEIRGFKEDEVPCDQKYKDMLKPVGTATPIPSGSKKD